MKAQLFLLILAICGGWACRKEAAPGGEIPLKQLARLEVKVTTCANAACDSVMLMPGAKIYLFDFEPYREEGSPIAFTGTTDESGKMLFSNLEKREYWLTIVMPQPDGRSKKEYAKTPERTTTFLEVTFPPQ